MASQEGTEPREPYPYLRWHAHGHSLMQAGTAAVCSSATAVPRSGDSTAAPSPVLQLFFLLPPLQCPLSLRKGELGVPFRAEPHQLLILGALTS